MILESNLECNETSHLALSKRYTNNNQPTTKIRIIGIDAMQDAMRLIDVGLDSVQEQLFKILLFELLSISSKRENSDWAWINQTLHVRKRIILIYNRNDLTSL